MTSHPEERPLNGAELREKFARLEERLKALDARIVRDAELAERALDVAAVELTRRLDILNHAHEDAKEALQTYVRQDLFERHCDDTEERLRRLEGFVAGRDEKLHSAISDAIAPLKDWQTNIQGRVIGISTFAALAVSILAALITHYLITTPH